MAGTKKSIFLPPDNTRLVTIVAHVDHGKTTLADNLIEHNGLISERLAGTLRYLDFDPEEQRRGITMRSSAIALKHKYTPPPTKKKAKSSSNEASDMIVHLLDSPGHTDFSMEVSSALVACDGALIVIDAVEGMGARSNQVLREAYRHQLVPILVVNKIDRLCTELCLSPTEAYLRLRNLLETVNATASAMITSARSMLHAQTPSVIDGNETTQTAVESSTTTATMSDEEKAKKEEEEEKVWTFDPGQGNVIFCSALFGWGFTVQSLTRALFRSNTIQMKPVQFKPFLFGDFKLNAAGDKIIKWKQSTAGDDDDNVPIFAKYGLKPIWSIYEGVAGATAALGLSSSLFADGRGGVIGNSTGNNNKQQTDVKIRADTPGMDQVLEWMQIGTTALSTVSKASAESSTARITTAEELKTVLTRTGASTEESVLRCLLRRYRPLSDAVLDAVCEHCPSPTTATSLIRSQTLTLQNYPKTESTEESVLQDYNNIRQGVLDCRYDDDAPAVAHICKFMSTDVAHIRDPGLNSVREAAKEDTNETTNGEKEESNVIIGLARILSGILKTGKEYYLMGPKYNPNDPSEASSLPKRAIRLYLLMGSTFIHVDEVPAGHLCAIYYDIKDVQLLKTVTICGSPNGMPLRGLESGVRPLVKVNIEPENSADTEALVRGLAKLALADAAVEVSSTVKGERVLACLGELHLEQSILDLERNYCGKEIKLRISDPIVDFSETTAWFEHEFDFAAFFDDSSPPLYQTTIPPYNEEEGILNAKHGRSRTVLSGRCAAIRVRAVPLAESVFRALGGSTELSDDGVEELLKLGKALACEEGTTANAVLETLRKLLLSIDAKGNALIESEGLRDGSCIVGVEADEIFVPSNEILKNKTENNDEGEEKNELDTNFESEKSRKTYERLNAKIKREGLMGSGKSSLEKSQEDEAAFKVWKSEMHGSLVAGFQLAARAGPVCEEPLRRVLVILEGAEVAVKNTHVSSKEWKASKPLSGGMVVASMRSGIRCALLSRPVRLMEGHLKLTLHSSLAGLGALYHVLSKRRGKVLDDSMVDGTDLLMITASVPQAGAFGLAPELFGKTSGEVTAPEMLFSHWECLDVDPFWIPTSEEEREDFGELQKAGDSSTGLDNTALSYIRMVRRRKGLVIDSSRTVVSAEKQRTMKK